MAYKISPELPEFYRRYSKKHFCLIFFWTQCTIYYTSTKLYCLL